MTYYVSKPIFTSRKLCFFTFFFVLFDNGSLETFSNELTIRSDVTRNMEATLGGSAVIDCTDGNYYNPSFCSIYNNTGQLYAQRCSASISIIRPNSAGNWTCAMGIPNNMQEINHTIVLRVVDDEHVEKIMVEKDGLLKLNCALKNSRASVSWCRAHTPQGRRFFLADNLSSGRYSSFSTNKTKEMKLCGLEIKLPLEKEDHGQWRIDIGISADDFTGCFFGVGNFTPPVAADSRVVEEIMAKVGEKLKIECSVPWPVQYCTLNGFGEVRRIGGYAALRKLRLGICQFEELYNNANNEFTCGLHSIEGSKIKYRTKITRFTMFENPEVSNDVTSKTANILFRTSLRQPLKWCKFTRQDDFSIILWPGISKNSKYSYWGAGLQYGECGILIQPTDIYDNGRWTCTVAVDVDNMEHEETYYLLVESSYFASTTGMAVGIAVVCSVGLFLVFREYKKRMVTRDRRTSMASVDSSDNIVMQTTYQSANARSAHPRTNICEPITESET